ncbi:MAG: undecaprenyl-diphosphatase [Frankiaceae bacterium]|nr:undecaprenyl-diphosphatase [Frankiaceae bacterium]MDQ1699440.1 undecaprenyl-diphosphatase [Frankiaceae bacterium]
MSDLSYLQAATIGLLQGVTELFPVSSLGHSILVPAWVGGSWGHLVTEQSTKASESSPYLAFIVATHVATAIALIVFYLRAWLRIVAGLWTSLRRRSIETPTERLGWLIVVATIPVGILGLALEHPLRVLFAKPLAAAVFLTINGIILLAGEQMLRRSRGDRDRPVAAARTRAADAGSQRVQQDEEVLVARVGWRDAVAVGLAQSLALLAGISRSGTTMVAGLVRGLDRESAANFAFLLATPVILAAGGLKLPELAKPAAAGIRGPTVVGAVLAGLASYVAVRFLTRYFENRSLRPFGIYCLIAGIVSVVHFA